jgi:hypothetical protein
MSDAHIATPKGQKSDQDTRTRFQQEVDREWKANAPKRTKEAQLEKSERKTDACLKEVHALYQELPADKKQGINSLDHLQLKVCHARTGAPFGTKD